MPHKVEISDKTYEKLREYCELNDLKMGSLADKLIYDGLMIEMYGDVPFTSYRVKTQKPVETIVVNGTVTKEGEFEQESVNRPKTLPELMKEHYDPISLKADGLTGEVVITHDTGQKMDKSRYIAHPTEEFVKEWTEIEKWTAEQGKAKETMKQAGVPEKVVNRITKRRLK